MPDASMPDASRPDASRPDAGRPGDKDGWPTSLWVPVVIVAIVVVLLGGIVIVAREDQALGLGTLTASSVDVGTLPQTIPFRYIAGHVVVDATFGGHETVPMILDTGAPTIIAEGLADRFGGDPPGSLPFASIDGEVTTSDVVPFSNLKLGDAVFRDVGGVVGFVSPDNPLSCTSGNGVIGASLMQDAVWQIDYATEHITIASSVDGLEHVDGAIRLDFERASEGSPSPLIELSAGEGALRLLVDTGSDGWISVNPDDLEGTGASVAVGAPAFSTIGAGMSGTFETRLAFTALDLELGDQLLPALPIATAETLAEGQGNVGNQFLANYVVTIDWLDDTIYLDPTNEAVTPLLPPSATIGWDGNDYVVGSFVEGIPVTDGLALRARIESIDGGDVTEATFDDFCARYTATPAADFEMTVADDVPITVEVASVEDFYAPLER